MSQPQRHPRVLVNGVQRMRTHHYYWCRQCRRTVRIASSINPTSPLSPPCPRCLAQLGPELDESRSRLLSADLTGLEPSPGARLLDSLAAMLHPSTMLNEGQDHDYEYDSDSSNRAWIVLQFIHPTQPPIPVSPPERAGAQAENGLEEMVREGERTGRRPAMGSAIEGLPRMEVTAAHLVRERQCAVCKDEFELGVEVRELPCSHLYHCHCIVPWLHIQNTCPVCRFELPAEDSPGNAPVSAGGVVAEGLNRWWNQLLSSWPVRLLSSWRPPRSNAFGGDHHGYWWPSWPIFYLCMRR